MRIWLRYANLGIGNEIANGRLGCFETGIPRIVFFFPSMEGSVLARKKDELPEWKRHYLENRHKSVDEKRIDQQRFLETTLQSLKSLFGALLLTALKKVEREQLSEVEETTLLEHQEANELLARIKGLKRAFPTKYYPAVDAVMGENTFKRRTKLLDQDEEKKIQEKKVEEEHAVKLPRGFSKWDLKQVKLNESFPDDGKDIWVEFFSLKGETAVGRILYNDAKDLLYFRPQDVSSGPIFPLTQDQGRKLTREGRNYYFKRAVHAPE